MTRRSRLTATPIACVAIAAIALLGCGGAAETSSDAGPRGAGGAGGAGASGEEGGAGRSSGGATNAGGAGGAPALVLCAPAPNGASFVATKTDTDPVNGDAWSYACVTPCTSALAGCSYPADARYPSYTRPDGSQHQKLAVDFVVDEMAGSIVYTLDGNDTIVLHSGSGGTSAGRSTALAHLVDEHSFARTVHVVWQTGHPDLFGPGEGTGWWTRKDGHAIDARTQVTRRPEVVLRFIHDELASGHAFGTIGCSLGTMATLGPVLWGDLDPLVDYQWSGGGSVFYDINASCGRVAPPYPSGGHCDSDASTCTVDADCPGGASDHCRLPTDVTTTNLAALIDYLSKTTGGPDACRTIPASPPYAATAAFDASSFVATPTRWSVSHRIHFVTDEDGPAGRPADQDVLEASAMFAYHAIAAASPDHQPYAWTDYDGHDHCDHFEGDDADLAETAALVISEMGL